MKYLLHLLFFVASTNAFATQAPNFTVTTSDNQTLQLYSNFTNQGKLVVIEAFFIACPPCATHAPLVQNLYTQMLAAHPGKIEFILLSTLSSDLNANVAQYKTSKGLTMPAVGSNGGSQTALQPYTSGQFGQFLGTPTFIVIAPNTGEVYFDIRGNSASATINLLSQKITELLPIAPPPPPVPIYCNVKDYFNVDLAPFQIEAKTTLFDTTFTAYGAYTLSNVAALSNKPYTIIPKRNDNPLNGLTTYDLVLISKHILGIEPLKCYWQRLAADVNCSGSITTYDIVTARKLILGIDQTLPCGSWRFVPDSASSSNGNCMEFLGVKSGDVTAGICDEFSPAPEDRAPWQLSIADRNLEAGETVYVALDAADLMDIQGLQAAIAVDPNYLTIKSLSSDLLEEFSDENFSLTQGQASTVAVSWVNAQGQRISQHATIWGLELAVKKAGKLSDLLKLNPEANIRTEAYDATGGAHPLEIIWRNERQSANFSPYLFKIAPNPASGQFVLSTTTDTDQDCLVELYDLQGRTILKQSFLAVKGYNHWPVRVDNGATGLFCIRVNGKSAGKVLLEK